MTVSFEFIQTISDLKALGSRLRKEDTLAVDIEADSLHHYITKVCLVQISTAGQTFIIDPLATETLAPILPLFTSEKIRKILHGADYDLRSLYRDYGTSITNVFDTMVASQFLGEKEPGLAAVLNKRFGIMLNKKYQRANWSKRPLSEAMLTYAAHDTAHLIPLYRALQKDLLEKGRLEWVEEECNRMSIECAKANNSHWACSHPNQTSTRRHCQNVLKREPLFKRFKGAGAMSPRDLAVLEKLLRFREKCAMKQDRPPFKVFGNRLIKELVQAKPMDLDAIKKIPGLPGDFMRRYAKGSLAAIKSAAELPEHRLPVYPKTPRPKRNPEKQARIKRLRIWRDSKAKALDLPPGLLCNNALLEALAECKPGNPESLKQVPGIRCWQKKVLGREIIGVMHGMENHIKHKTGEENIS
ncbi:MAG: HRDC domain-containing protein [Deltaproteobacteria bacterium]|nr:HRDC domain-containing protein [Deltaproteobacteria bacterium]